MTRRRLRFTIQNSIDRGLLVRSFSSNRFPRLKVNVIGPEGIDNVAADLIDLGIAVFLIERNLPGKQHTNRALKISLELGIRTPNVWTEAVVKTLSEILLFMGGTHWDFDFFPVKKPDTQVVLSKETLKSKRVALFSGGLDSLCGAATVCRDDDTRLVSYYTGQKDLQKGLAASIEMRTPVQWSVRSGSFLGRGTNYLYRSFMFLCLAAVTAQSYGARNILQFENGILASGITPSPSGRSTKHAHYRVHRLCEAVFSKILGGDWTIENPFQHKTKREAFIEMTQKLGDRKARELAEKTKSCWHLYAGYKDERLGKKKNGEPCGFCVPCLVRQTAHPLQTWRNLRSDDARNHPIHGHFFREFYAMLHSIQCARNGSLGDFYTAVGSSLYDAIKPRGGYELSEVRDLFLRFADEFMVTYGFGKKK
jgi:7-cyano-7-deazaguanine synthase in queuosine biosynthesis